MSTFNDQPGILPRFISHTVTSGEATANQVVLPTTFNTNVSGGVSYSAAGVLGWVVQVYRAGVNVLADGVVSLSAGHDTLTVADGGVTFDLAQGDQIFAVIWGRRQ